MRMKVKDFTITPVLCPINLTDCSPCKHAGAFSVRNPHSSGAAPTNYGEHECSYFEYYEKKFKEESKKMA